MLSPAELNFLNKAIFSNNLVVTINSVDTFCPPNLDTFTLLRTLPDDVIRDGLVRYRQSLIQQVNEQIAAQQAALTQSNADLVSIQGITIG